MLNSKRTQKIKVTRTGLFDQEDTQPLKPGTRFVPDWYKKSPHTADPNKQYYNYDGTPLTFPGPILPHLMTGATYKRCMPMLDAMTMGYVFELSEDVYFDEASQSFSPTNCVQQHTHKSSQESEGYVFPVDAYERLFKWNSDRLVELPLGYTALFMTPLHRNDLPFYTLAGVVDLDRHPLPVNPPFVMKRGFSGVIPKGTPLWQLIPIKKEPWEVELQPDSPLSDEVLYNFFEPNELGNCITGVYKRKIREQKDYN
jgi:hypothetical protein